MKLSGDEMNTLKIFSAGVAMRLSRETIDRFKELHPSIEIEFEAGGSTAGVNNLLGGKHYDVMILADSGNIDEMLMPDLARGYRVWGGNRMVVSGTDITQDNWKDKLLDPNSAIKHVNPYNDPGGYRAVMAMKLADRYEEGLSEKLFANPGYKGLEREQYKDFKKPGPLNDGEYRISYASIPVGLGMPYAELPEVMNLGNPEYESLYNSVSFEVDGGKTVYGNTIMHAILIPENCENRELAEAFVDMFLDHDFTQYGFTDVKKIVGEI